MKQEWKKGKRQARVSGFRVVSGRKKSTDIFSFLLQTAIVFMGVYGAAYALADGIQIPHMKKKLDIIILVTVLSYSLVFCLKKYVLVSIPIVLLIYGRLFYVYRAVLLQGFYHFENVIIHWMNEYFNTNLLYFVAKGESAYVLTLILAFVVQILTLFCSLAVYEGVLRQLLYLLFIVFAGTPFIFGRSASGVTLILLTAVVLYLASMGLVPQVDNELSGKRKNSSFAFYALGIYGILLLLFAVFISNESFERSQPVRAEIRRKVEQAVREIDLSPLLEKTSTRFKDFFFSDEERFFNIGQDGGSYTGGVGGGRLGGGSVKFTNEAQLKLMLPVNTKTLYMKGFSGVYYEKDAWGGFSKEDAKRYQDLLLAYGNEKFSGQDLAGQFLELLNSGVISPTNDQAVIDMTAMGFNPINKMTMIVDYVKAAKEYRYLPYFSEEGGGLNAVAEMDSYYLPKKNAESYTTSYYALNSENIRAFFNYLNGNGRSNASFAVVDNLINGYSQFEQEYGKFVYDVYTVLPEENSKLYLFTRENFSDVSPFRSRDGQVSFSASEVLDKVDEIKDFLARQTRYSLTPGKLPKGKDFAEYFLFENRQGYCVHYATTAVLMLRSLGIPSRYVEGYIVTEEDVLSGIKGGGTGAVSYTINENGTVTQTEFTQGMVTAEIRDTNAHAWIEVYLMGFGWVPMEVTAGYPAQGVVTGFNSQIKEQIEAVPSPTRLPTNTPTPGASSGTASGNVNAEDEEPISPSPSPSLGASAGNSAGDEEPDREGTWFAELSPAMRFLVCMSILILLSLFSCILRYAVFLKIRKNRLTKGKANQQILCIYQEMERILRKIPVYKSQEITYLEFAKKAAIRERVPDDFPEIMALVLKARFSDEVIAKEECELAAACYSLLRKRFYAEVYGNKRRWYKYILLL